MTLNIQEQNETMREFVNEQFIKKNNTATVTTAEIITETLNIDTFVTNNLSAINNAFSASFRTKTTPQQRLTLFKLVIRRLELQ